MVSSLARPYQRFDESQGRRTTQEGGETGRPESKGKPTDTARTSRNSGTLSRSEGDLYKIPARRPSGLCIGGPAWGSSDVFMPYHTKLCIAVAAPFLLASSWRLGSAGRLMPLDKEACSDRVVALARSVLANAS